jgi:hypothetical protein
VKEARNCTPVEAIVHWNYNYLLIRAHTTWA